MDTTKTLISLTASDWPAVKRIYEAGIQTGNATFQAAAPADWQTWSAGKILPCCLGLHIGPALVGWASLSSTSSRDCYRGVGEVSIYVDPEFSGHGVGSQLLPALIATSEQQGFWTLQSSIFPENKASLHLHEKFGFRVVGRREKVARMEYGPYAGQWRDTLWIERRSPVVGIE